jgi:hypothetical protein
VNVNVKAVRLVHARIVLANLANARDANVKNNFLKFNTI